MNKYASGNKDVEIILLIDNNEDKSTAELKIETKASQNDLKSIFNGKSPLSHIHSIIYLDTLGKFYQDSFIKEKKDSIVLDFTEPLELHGEGIYSLNVVKKIETTEGFLNLDQENKHCQNSEKLETCLTRLHLEIFINNCSCVPYTIKDFSKVNKKILI